MTQIVIRRVEDVLAEFAEDAASRRAVEAHLEIFPVFIKVGSMALALFGWIPLGLTIFLRSQLRLALSRPRSAPVTLTRALLAQDPLRVVFIIKINFDSLLSTLYSLEDKSGNSIIRYYLV